MFIIDANNVIIDMADNIHIEGGYIVVEKDEPIYYMNWGLTIINQDVSPGVIPQAFLYQDSQFIANPNYVNPNETQS